MKLESRHEAAFNAAGEAMQELGFGTVSLNYDQRWSGVPLFVATGKVEGRDYIAASGDTAALAIAELVKRTNEALAKPPPLAAAKEVKEAAKAIVEEARSAAVYPAELDEIADRIEALAVKE